MIRSYFITALRALARNKVTTIINIGGLAAGIAASVMIMLYVFSELSVDRFNDNYEAIYRLEVGDFPVTGTAQALLLKEEFPEVLQSARMDFRHRPLIRLGEDYYRFENFVYADSTLFDVFTFQFVKGNPSTALQLPFSVVLTTTEAEKLFGDEDPMGKMIRFNDNHDYTVTAIIKDVDNFHLPVDAVGSFASLPYVENDDDHDRHLFSYMNFFTYVLLDGNSDHEVVAEKFDRLIDDRFPDARRFSFRLRPLNDIYFNTDLQDSPPVRHGNLSLVYTLIAVAGLILLIAIVNFINLSTANASVRYAEIGIRKVMGAAKSNLTTQFLTESVIISALAFFIGVVIVETLLPVFNDLLTTHLSFNPFDSWTLFFALLSLIIVTGVLAGLYPALYLSSLKSSSILKGEITRGRGALYFRRVLIVFQFTISIALIIGTIMVHRQVEYMRNKPLGFNKQDVVTVRLNRDVFSSMDIFRDNLEKYDAIESVSMSNNLPGYVTWFNTWMIEGEEKPHRFLPVDPEYIDLMEIKIKSGRNFDRDRMADQELTFILNEQAVKYFGFEDPAGKEFMVGGPSPVRIIGVIEDFHFRSLHEPVGPLVLGWRDNSLGIANIRISGGDASEAVSFIRQEWEAISPGSYFEYRYLDEEIDKLYRSEIRIGKLFRYFALLAIIISCMGLYGLSTFVTLQRTKEIGIRKVLGSSVTQIVFLLTSEFARWVIASNFISWPLAYIVMKGWLENFPYRIELGLEVFVFAGLIALLVALITVGGQSWRRAVINPAYTLRNE